MSVLESNIYCCDIAFGIVSISNGQVVYASNVFVFLNLIDASTSNFVDVTSFDEVYLGFCYSKCISPIWLKSIGLNHGCLSFSFVLEREGFKHSKMIALYENFSGLHHLFIFLFVDNGTIGSKSEEIKASVDSLNARGAVLMVCRTCGKKGDHWTSRCPYKDLAPQPDASFVDKPAAPETAAPASNTGKGAYVPPGMRGGPAAERGGTDMRRRNDENSVRVTNLSEDTREPDLLELFRPFGAVSRVYVAVDQKTGMSRGFGFVNFVNREDAQRAINKLNGYGYDNLILRVEWATPRTN